MTWDPTKTKKQNLPTIYNINQSKLQEDKIKQKIRVKQKSKKSHQTKYKIIINEKTNNKKYKKQQHHLH